MSSPNPKPKLKLTPEILERHGITYNEVVIDHHNLRHINTIREGLLDFDSILIREIAHNPSPGTWPNYDEIPASAFRNSGRLEKLDEEILHDFILTAKDISFRTQELHDGRCAEADWQSLFRTTIFKARRDPRRSKAFAEKIACNASGVHQWKEAHSIRGLNEAHMLPTIPKPDFYFGFTIYESKRYRNYGFEKEDSFQNFTDRTLLHLKSKGLCSAPTSGFAAYLKDKNSMSRHDLLCFPWAVVELKKSEEGNRRSETTRAYCQAANATSTALCMLENLAQGPERKWNNQHIPPVVGFTCVGGKCKVWLTYSHPASERKRDHRMISIWEGSLEKIWDAIQFCQIVHNLSCWAEDTLRRQTSDLIGQWRAELQIPGQSSPSNLVQSVTTREEEEAATTPQKPKFGEDSKTKHDRPLHAIFQDAFSLNVTSNQSKKAAGLSSETTEPLKRFDAEAARLVATSNFNIPQFTQFTPSKQSTGRFSGAKGFSSPFLEQEPGRHRDQGVSPPVTSSVIDQAIPKNSLAGTMFESYLLRDSFFGVQNKADSSEQSHITDPSTAIFGEFIFGESSSGEESSTDFVPITPFKTRLPKDTSLRKQSKVALKTSRLSKTTNETSRPLFKTRPVGGDPAGGNDQGGASSKDPSDSGQPGNLFGFGKPAHAIRNVLAKQDETEVDMSSFLVPQLKGLAIKSDQDSEENELNPGFASPEIFDTTKLKNVLAARKIKVKLPPPAKTTSFPPKEPAVTPPLTSKIWPGPSSTQGSTVLPIFGSTNFNLFAPPFSAVERATEEVYESSAKRNHKDHQQRGREIRPAGGAFIPDDREPRYTDASSSKRTRVESTNENETRLPSFDTYDALLDITYLNLPRDETLEKRNKKDGMSTENANLDEEDEDNWGDIESDEDEV